MFRALVALSVGRSGGSLLGSTGVAYGLVCLCTRFFHAISGKLLGVREAAMLPVATVGLSFAIG